MTADAKKVPYRVVSVDVDEDGALSVKLSDGEPLPAAAASGAAGETEAGA